MRDSTSQQHLLANSLGMNPEKIDTILEANTPHLTANERERVWRNVAARIATPAPIPSPYWNFVTTKSMVPAMIALVLIMGVSGTVAASESAKPGDALFPLERATERARLALASKDREGELRTRFANERLAELQAILDEEAIAAHERTDDSSLFGVTGFGKRAPITDLEIEVDVFEDITVVKVERGDVTTRFTTTADTTTDVIAEIMRRYGFTESEVTEAMNFEIEDRVSRPSERGGVITSNQGEERVGVAVTALLDQLDEIDDVAGRDWLIAALIREINHVVVSGESGSVLRPRFTTDARIKIDDDRFEIREDGYRLRIDTDDDRDEDDYDDEDNRGDDSWTSGAYDDDASNDDTDDRDDDSSGHGSDDDTDDQDDTDDEDTSDDYREEDERDEAEDGRDDDHENTDEDDSDDNGGSGSSSDEEKDEEDRDDEDKDEEDRDDEDNDAEKDEDDSI